MALLRSYFLNVFRRDPAEILPLNGVRGIAYFMLIYVHITHAVEFKLAPANEFLLRFIYNSSSCIDMFFVLSGYLIAGQLMRELSRSGTIDLKKFYLKRTLRIFPPYYLFLLFQTFWVIPMAAKINPAMGEQIRALQSRSIYDFLYISNYFDGTLPHGWSLSLEEQFYLFFPLILLIAFTRVPQKNWPYVLLVLYILPLAYRFWIHYNILVNVPPADARVAYLKWIYTPTQGHIDAIIPGAIAAYIVDFRKDLWEKMTSSALRRGLWQGGAAALWLLITFSVHEYEPGVGSQVLRFNAYSIAWGILILISLHPQSIAAKVLSLQIWAIPARLSYCAYLLHILASGILIRRFLMRPIISLSDIFIMWIPTALGVLGFAYILHLIAERPFMMLRDRLVAALKGSRQRPGAPTAA